MKFQLKEIIAPLFLSIILLFASCNQYSDIDEYSGSNFNNYAQNNTKFSKFERLLTDIEIVNIGVSHNNYAELIMENNPKNLIELKNSVFNIQPNLSTQNELLNDYLNIEFTYENLVKIINLNKDFFINSKLLSDKIMELKYLVTNEQLQQHQNNTRKDLSGVDLDTYLVLNTVLQYSGDFWQSQNINLTTMKVNSWQQADGVSAAIGFLTFAAVASAVSLIGVATGGTGVIPTVSLVASLCGIGFSSALASVAYLVT